MRKMMIAATLTLVLAGTTAAAAPRDREAGRGGRGRDETPIVKFVKAVQRLFGVGTQGLPSVPIP